MKVIIADGDKTSLTVDLLRYCESRGILVEEKFTPTNNERDKIAVELLKRWHAQWNNDDTSFIDSSLVDESIKFINSTATPPVS